MSQGLRGVSRGDVGWSVRHLWVSGCLAQIPTSVFSAPCELRQSQNQTNWIHSLACQIVIAIMASTTNEKDPWNRDTKNKFEGKDRSEFLDPCQEAAARSIRCLNRNGGDRTLCSDYFQAYRDCKKSWISPQCTDASRKVYSLLAVRHLERAADLTENSAKLEAIDRGLLTEEEVCLYYRVMHNHGTKEEYVSRLKSPKLGAISQLKEGRKVLFCEGLDALETWGEWDLIYNLCREALTLGLDGGTSPFFVCDLQTWRKFVSAASKVADSESALGEVQAILKRYIDIKDTASAMYKKNLSLALLETTFRLPATALNDSNENNGLSPRVVQIGLFLDQYFERLSAFDDVKGYVAELNFEEIKALMEDALPKMLDEDADKGRKTVLNALCRFCTQPTDLPCESCLKKLVVDAAGAYRQITSDKELVDSIPRLDKDPRLDLALVMGNSLLKLSGLRPRTADASQSLWQSIEPGLFLQAVLLLDTQLNETPGDTELRLLLVQLYLLLGCASYAYRLWTPLDVKRTIQDSLSPLFFDRISTMSPGLFQGGRPLMEPLRAFYKNNLTDKAPVRIWDAFSAGSYTSILDMINHDSSLRRSCTLMMTLVEERRAIRCYGGKIDCEIEQHPLTEKHRGRHNPGQQDRLRAVPQPRKACTAHQSTSTSVSGPASRTTSPPSKPKRPLRDREYTARDALPP
ncbi:hypothetical protein CHGG_10940 [Chaetomium globosum CBS 148.51]|uniref:Uncharacterized protein n=1 Tax=Chaetomium globosum (strain ATCC 6205 / CBS 148.51 / DSM 1962 / NBRC 6347 / NRRL 1970) TaxID=306901 RepID=Q2GM64_CHAGB|nr:uncharacterized protein CHGG_10940 [Chaetomium globosum CBS 148.51]EAQ83122.1 hypothetical protein CHGG_10940 [Chaetomium globosum CBS 148.51]